MKVISTQNTLRGFISAVSILVALLFFIGLVHTQTSDYIVNKKASRRDLLNGDLLSKKELQGNLYGAMFLKMIGNNEKFMGANDHENVELIGRWPAEYFALDVEVRGNYAYVAEGYAGLKIIDVSIPQNPFQIGCFNIEERVDGVDVMGNYAYLACFDSSFWVVNISNPTNPVASGFLKTRRRAMSVAVSGNYAYVSVWRFGGGLQVINISDPTNPFEAGYFDVGYNTFDVAVSNNYAYLASQSYGLRIIDISTPTNPHEIGFFETPGSSYGVAVSGDYAYVADWAGGLRVINVSNPTNPLEEGFFDEITEARGLAVSGNYAYVADYNPCIFWVINVSDPKNPFKAGFFDVNGGGYDVAVSGEYAYMADGSAGLYIFKYISEPFQPFTFAHMTDVHIGWEKTAESSSPYTTPEFVLYGTYFTEALQHIASLDPKPEFILITGDNVEWAKKEYFDYFKSFANIFTTRQNIPIYSIPGNHDRYSPFPFNDHLEQYYDYMGRPDEDNNVNIFPGFDIYNPPDEFSDEGLDWYNYSFYHKSYLFIGLDSGADVYYPPNNPPKGGGLHDLQIAALNSLAQSYNIPKMIFMHHPIFTGPENGDNASIVNNRQSFIDYCKDNNVNLVLSGHTHKDHRYDKDETIFIQTPSVTKDADEFARGYRIIQVEDENMVIPLPYSHTPSLEKFVEFSTGPVNLHTYDSQGRHTGFGSIIVEIPDSYYTGYYDSLTPQVIILYDISEDYRFEVEGTEEGSADIGIIGNDLLIQMQDLSVTTTTIDKMNFEEDSTFTYTTNDQEKDFSVSLVRELEDKSRVFIISNSTISNADSSKFQVVDNQSLKYTNIGSPKTYDLYLSQVGVDSGVFEYTNISMGENEAQIITPADWEDLENEPVLIFIDEDLDGTPDDSIFVDNQLTPVNDFSEINTIPDKHKLFQNYPNPFNIRTTIYYQLMSNADINLTIYNINGEVISNLTKENQQAGHHQFVWTGKDYKGQLMPSGLYFYRLKAGDFIKTKRMILLK